MNVRITLLAAAVALLAFSGCGDSGRNDNDAGCTTCTADSGTPDSGTPDSGTPDSGTPDSGTPDSGTPDGGGTDGGSACVYIPHSDGGAVDVAIDPAAATPLTIAQLRYGHLPDGGFIPNGTQKPNYPSAHVAISGAVVQTIDFISADGGSSNFWIVDPNDPSSGFFVAKSNGDPAYVPQVGDVVTVDGVFKNLPGYFAPSGDRYELFKSTNTPLTVTKTDGGASVADNAADAGCTFDAQGGTRYFSQRQQAFAGTRLHINGPLTLTDPNPIPMANVRLEQDGGASITSYRGFEVSGGILVATSNTYNADGGFGAANGRCDWAELARADGGLVTFPDGVSGVWETYTNPPCDGFDDGGCNSRKPYGYIPTASAPFPTRLSDGGVQSPSGSQDYTFVLYPQNCADLPGDAGAGVTP